MPTSRLLSFGRLILLASVIACALLTFGGLTVVADPPQPPAARTPDIERSQDLLVAQNAPRRLTYVYITGVQPPKAATGSIVTITFGRFSTPEESPTEAPGQPQVQVLFDALNAEVVNIAESGIAVRVPRDLADPNPKITLTGDLRSSAYSGFELDQRSFLANWIWVLGVIIIAVFVLVFVWALRREKRAQAKLASELDLLRYSFDREGTRRASNRDSTTPDGRMERIPEVPTALAEACARGDCILFAGTGLSAQAGLPTWSQFLIEFLSRLDRAEGTSTWSSLNEHVERRNFSLVLDIIQARGRFEALVEDIKRTFVGTHSLPYELVDFFSDVPLSGVVTSALDSSIEESCSHRDGQVLAPRKLADYASLASLLRDRKFFILKLGGAASDPKSLVLTPQAYTQCLEEVPDLRTFLGSLFTTQTILFMGTSVETIEWFLTSTGIRDGGTIPHFALVPQRRDIEFDVERFRSRFNITLLPFVTSPRFPEVARFIRTLMDRVGEIRSSSTGVMTSRRSELTAARIERLTLKNIGPFGEAEFHFRNPWTLILGNNGCGKSTVIRAVALALCGDDEKARDAGGTLLKTGAAGGSIKLSVNSIDYQTTLSTEQGRIQVKAGQIAPLRNGTLLALGIPAVRGVASREEGGLFAQAVPYPRVDDVVPLLYGGLDFRMGSIKQWIISSYSRSQDGKLSTSERSRYRQMLSTFFSIIDDMVPGFRIEFDHCNTVTSKIYLRTSDGVLPLEYVSQGMSSTIGWAGALIQRMYDIYDKAEHPEREYAVLLIDEIDSHLHPEWQRLLVPRIKKHLPKLQVIATTHSPLLVGNMGEKELIRLVRTDGISVEHIDESFSGYRADQILTGVPFGMDSSRDVEWDEKRSRYSSLLGKTERTEQEQSEFVRLEGKLKAGPRTGETETARRGAELIDKALEAQLDELALTDDDKTALLTEAHDYFAKVTRE